MVSAGKVLIIVQNLPVPFDRRVWLESMALRDAGYQISVISPTGQHGKYQSKHEEIDGIHVYRYPAPVEAQGTIGYLLEFAYCWFMATVLATYVWIRRGFDVVHACNPPETYFLLAWPFKLLGKKFIFDHHDLSPEMYLAKGAEKSSFLYKGLLWLEYQTFRAADVVITTNQSHKNIAVQRGNMAEEDVFIVRSGPDFERLQMMEPEVDLKDGHEYLVCYLGEMCAQDGVDLLLYAIKHLHEHLSRNDVKFALMGGGPELDKLRQLASELELDNFVELTGRVSDHDLCRYLSTADLCVDPDPYSEWSNQSTMNKIMEYMAFSKPIVAFDLLENRYSAQDAAVYAEPNKVDEMAQLISKLLDNKEKRIEMGQYGQQRVREKLLWDHSKPFLYEAYSKALQKPLEMPLQTSEN